MAKAKRTNNKSRLSEKARAAYMSDLVFFQKQLDETSDPSLYFQIAMVSAYLENYDDVISASNEGLKAYPEFHQLETLRAQAFLNTGRKADAQEMLINIVLIDEDNCKALKLLGMSYKNDNKEQAITYLRAAYFKAPEDTEIYAALEEMGGLPTMDMQDLSLGKNSDDFAANSPFPTVDYDVDKSVADAKTAMDDVLNEFSASKNKSAEPAKQVEQVKPLTPPPPPAPEPKPVITDTPTVSVPDEPVATPKPVAIPEPVEEKAPEIAITPETPKQEESKKEEPVVEKSKSEEKPKPAEKIPDKEPTTPAPEPLKQNEIEKFDEMLSQGTDDLLANALASMSNDNTAKKASPTTKVPDDEPEDDDLGELSLDSLTLTTEDSDDDDYDDVDLIDTPLQTSKKAKVTKTVDEMLKQVNNDTSEETNDSNEKPDDERLAPLVPEGLLKDITNSMENENKEDDTRIDPDDLESLKKMKDF